MKKLLFVLGIISTMTTLSAETIFCPSQIACIDNGNGALCQVYKGDNRWFQDVWSQPVTSIKLPKTNTPFYFKFSGTGFGYPAAISNGCSYDVDNSQFICFVNRLSIVPDTHNPQNNWVTGPIQNSKFCIGSSEQCPYVHVAFHK